MWKCVTQNIGSVRLCVAIYSCVWCHILFCIVVVYGTHCVVCGHTLLLLMCKHFKKRYVFHYLKHTNNNLWLRTQLYLWMLAQSCELSHKNVLLKSFTQIYNTISTSTLNASTSPSETLICHTPFALDIGLRIGLLIRQWKTRNRNTDRRRQELTRQWQRSKEREEHRSTWAKDAN